MTTYGDQLRQRQEVAKQEVAKLEDELVLARVRVKRLQAEIQGYQDMTAEMTIRKWNLAKKHAERDRLGGDRSGSSPRMGGYLALLDALGEPVVKSMSDLDIERQNEEEDDDE